MGRGIVAWISGLIEVHDYLLASSPNHIREKQRENLYRVNLPDVIVSTG
jgi:hypothetical protein